MTPDIADIRGLLEADADAAHLMPPDPQRLLAAAHRAHRRRISAAGGALIVILGGAAAITAAVQRADTSETNTIVPAGPSASAADPRVEALQTPIVLAHGRVRFDPAGELPPGSASYETLLSNDRWAANSGSLRLVYALLSDDDPASYLLSRKLGVEPPLHLVRRPAVLLIHSAPNYANGLPVTQFIALDPTSAQPLLRGNASDPQPASTCAGDVSLATSTGRTVALQGERAIAITLHVGESITLRATGSCGGQVSGTPQSSGVVEVVGTGLPRTFRAVGVGKVALQFFYPMCAQMPAPAPNSCLGGVSGAGLAEVSVKAP